MRPSGGPSAGSGDDTGRGDRFATWSFKLPKKIVSLNKVKLFKTYEYRKYRDEWMWLTRIAAKQSHRQPPWECITPGRRRNKTMGPVKAVLEITRYGIRELDQDNLVGGCKALVDALVCEGLIYDDNSRWMRASYHQVQAPEYSADIHLAYTELPDARL